LIARMVLWLLGKPWGRSASPPTPW
jgi:hypothetical protein